MTSRLPSPVTSVLEPWRLAAPKEVTFWSGAGISRDAPASLPLGDELTAAVLDHGCGPGFAQLLAKRLRAVGVRDAHGMVKALPRLEGVLQPLLGQLGPAVALAPFAPLASVQPNDLHRFFAAHLNAGGRHLTVNFDQGIERAAATSDVHCLTHLHGTYDPNNLRGMRTEIAELGRGLDGAEAAAIREALASSSQIVFVGYSGRDFFDVDPYIRGLEIEGFALRPGLEVIWIDHAKAQAEREDWWENRRAGVNVLSPLHRMGAEVRYLEGTTREVLAQASSDWGLHIADAPPSVHLTTSPPASAPDETKQQLARAAVFQYMSMGGDLVSLYRGIPRRQAKLRRDLRPSYAIGLIKTGRYRRGILNSLSRQSLRGPGLTDAVRNAGGSFELQGAWARAGLLHLLALQRLPRLDPDLNGDQIWEIQHSYLAWLRNLRRIFPVHLVEFGIDLFSLPDPNEVWQGLARDERYIAGHPRAVSQLARLDQELKLGSWAQAPPLLQGRYSALAIPYGETDDLLGTINTRRQSLQARVAAGNLPGELDFIALGEGAEAIGDLPGILKAELMRRHVAGGDGRFIQALMRVGWTYPRKILFLKRWLRGQSWPLG